MRNLICVVFLLSALFATSLLAQENPTTIMRPSAQIGQQYEEVRDNILKAAAAMPEENYSFTPTDAERTFGSWVAYVADLQLLDCSRISGHTKTIDAQLMKTKADLIGALRTSFDTCDAIYQATTDENAGDRVPFVYFVTGDKSPHVGASRIAALVINLARDSEYYGSMVVYLRLKGIAPPTTVDGRPMLPSGGATGGFRAPTAGGR